MTDDPDHLFLICATCEGAAHADALMAAAAARLPARFALRTVDCMAGCERPTTVGFQAIGKAQYLFGDITSATDLDALVAFAHQYARSADGWTNATDRPLALMDKTLSRMPRIAQEMPR